MYTLPVLLMLGGLVTQDRPVANFHALSVSSGVQVAVKRGEKPALRLTGASEDLEKVSTAVEAGTLKIEPKGFHASNGKIIAEVTVPSWDSLEASGGVTVSGLGLSGSACSLEASGGAEVNLQNVTCETLAVDASGGCEIRLSGAAKKLALEASGGVELETRALKVSQAKVNASGGVSGALAVADDLDAELSGGVNLTIKGKPRVARAGTSISAKLHYE